MNSAKKISYMIIALLFVHVIIILTSWTLLNTTLARINNDTKIVNMLGQFRGGIQRATKYFVCEDSKERGSLVTQEVDAKLSQTLNLVNSFFNEESEEKETLIRNWERFKTFEKECREKHEEECREKLLYKSDKLWDDANALIYKIEEESAKKLKQLDMLYILIVTEFLLVLLLIYTIYKMVNKTLGDSQEQMSKYIDIIDKNVITSKTDLKGIITYASEAFCEISGFSKNELIGKNHNIVNHPDMGCEVFEELWKTIQEGKTWSGEIKNMRKDGTYYWVHSEISPYFEHGKHVGYMAVRIDISDKKMLEIVSVTDKLTQLFNRVKLDTEIMKLTENTKRKSDNFSVILIDIDHFKSVNDTYGHLVGDKVLQEAAKLLKENVRSSDIVGRWGGEEFLIVCPDSNLMSAKTLAEKLRKAIESFQFSEVGHKTASFGVSEYGGDESDDTLIKRVDEALYISKESGRNQVKTL